jgi:hypothetical protein
VHDAVAYLTGCTSAERGKRMSPLFSEQQIKDAASALKSHKEKPFVSHTWEELVSCLSHDSDPVLREKMVRELDEILKKNPGFKSFMMS